MSPCRVLVTRAGSGAANNLIRSLRTGAPSLVVSGCHDDAFYLKKSIADVNYLVPPTHTVDFVRAMRRIVHRERLDLIIPTTDVDVHALSRHRRAFGRRLFLPNPDTVALCQNKFALTRALATRGVPVPPTRLVSRLARLRPIFRELQSQPYLWCRKRRGTGSVAATPVKTVVQARAWINYWHRMRGVPPGEFTLSEYLPGRDFACQSLWRRGRLVLIKTTERISYFRGESGPSGVSSIGAVHKTVREPRVVDIAVNAVRSIDANASGAFSIDLKEDRHGVPCVTEINVGRLLTGTSIFDLTGKHNMAVMYVDLARGNNDHAPEVSEPYDVAEDYYMVRDLDALPDIFHSSELRSSFVDLRRIGRTKDG